MLLLFLIPIYNGNRDEHHSGQNPFMSDSDHWPGQSAGGEDFPASLTHGNIIALFNDDRWLLATPEEHFKSMGFRYPNGMDEVLKTLELPFYVHNKFARNGMHLFAMSIWMAVIMSQCRLKEEMSLPPVFFQDEQDYWQSSDDEEPASGCGQQLGQSSAAETQA